jgi:hypothetical protein
MKNKRPAKATIVALMMWICCLMHANAHTELYENYKHLTDVTVACVMNYRVNDTTEVEITLLAPHTKEAVYYLAEEFNLGIEKDIIDEGLGNKGNISLFRKLVHKDDPTKSYGVVSGDDDLKDVSMLVYNVNIGTVLIFQDIETMERIKVISDFLTTALTKPEILKNIEQIIK